MKHLILLTVILILLVIAGFAQQPITIGFTVSKTGALNVDSLEAHLVTLKPTPEELIWWMGHEEELLEVD